ncbi:MAG: type II toxin-antitoxin system VapC family toxin [Alphaproteobacteria bacterium]|nr:type II toxin-antitoxin system VapC family toxin [Alphaproteobacteria bacterium]
MTIRYLLDSDICIYIRRKRPPAVGAKFDLLTPGEVAMSVITYGELFSGAVKNPDPRALPELARMAALAPVLGLSEGAGEIYGRIRAKLETQGRNIGNNDLWIAAHAISADLTLVTNNEREFRRIDGLKIENWAK